MTRLPTQTAPTTEAFLARSGPELADLCTACGACFRACPIADHLGLASADSGAVTADLRKLAKGEPAALPETLQWVGSCAKSGLCIPACPEHDKGLDARLLVRIARQNALNVTRQIATKHDATAFPRVKVFARLQLTDEEQKRWL